MTALHADRGALVSGGASGIGLAVARRFVDEDARVWILGTRTEILAVALAELASDRAGGSICDASDEDQVVDSFIEAYRAIGGQGRPVVELDAYLDDPTARARLSATSPPDAPANRARSRRSCRFSPLRKRRT